MSSKQNTDIKKSPNAGDKNKKCEEFTGTWKINGEVDTNTRAQILQAIHWPLVFIVTLFIILFILIAASKLKNLPEGNLKSGFDKVFNWMKDFIETFLPFLQEIKPAIIKKIEKTIEKPEKPFYFILILTLLGAILYKSQPNNVIINDNRELYALISTLFLVFNVGIYKFFRKGFS